MPRAMPIEAIATAESVTLVREHDGIRTTLEVALVANTPAEERRLTIENLSGRERRLEVTTYAELVLNTPVADAAHPAFSKLFVQTEWSEAQQALLAMRRLRATDDEPLWVIHTLRSVGWRDEALVRDGPHALHRARTHDGATDVAGCWCGAEWHGWRGARSDLEPAHFRHGGGWGERGDRRAARRWTYARGSARDRRRARGASRA